MAELTSPRAVRLAAPRWLDARLVLGILLVLLSIVAGARVLASADHYTKVYVAARDLAPGEHLTSADLTVGQVRLHGQAGHYVAAGAAPVGYVVTRYVGAGELLPAAALAGTGPAPASRFVTVPVAAGHLSDDLQRGQLVDVYLTPKAAAGQAVPAPTLVLAGAAVQSRSGGSRTFGADSSVSVVLAVPIAKVADVVHAVESGSIDLVAVPTATGAGS
ncbi:MAG: SAF domain-containing protein [Frankiales bacterium]|nr:SAF domain-containing protein [Frankiales bacterium]